MFAAFFNQTFKSQTEEVKDAFQKHSGLLAWRYLLNFPVTGNYSPVN
jgi:hypothetical protein